MRTISGLHFALVTAREPTEHSGASFMLIMSRTVGEVVNIGGDIEVTVVAVKGHQVRIGVNAPRTVGVDREEIASRRRHERAHPSKSKFTSVC